LPRSNPGLSYAYLKRSLNMIEISTRLYDGLVIGLYLALLIGFIIGYFTGHFIGKYSKYSK
jgi:hypothetical protein